MDLLITPGKLGRVITVPSSKSAGHRMLIAAALSDGEVKEVTPSEDIDATLRCIEALGKRVENSFHSHDSKHDFTFRNGEKPEAFCLDCNESGSTLRFFVPLAIALYPGEEIVFKGSKRLLERPLTSYFEIFEKDGVSYELTPETLMVKGELKGGEYKLSGKISSQFITGLMFALPLLKTPSKIVITDALESKGYVDMTIDTLKKAGIIVENKDYREFIIPCNQKYQLCKEKVESDFSQAAFFLTANFLGSDIKVLGLDMNSKQGDKAILEILEKFKKNEDITVDVSDIPDLVPIMAVASSLRVGCKTHFINGARLRMKESDRIKTTCDMIISLGGEVYEEENGITVIGKELLSGGEVNCHNDHRIAMAAAIAATVCASEVKLLGAECVKKSYPGFWEDYQILGGKIKEDGR